jgi:hypothetical protein
VRYPHVAAPLPSFCPVRGGANVSERFNGYGNYIAELYPDEPRTPQRPLREGQTAR